MLTGLNFRLPFSETGPTFPLSQLSTARHWQDAESMITERWQSGRSRRTRNAVGRKVPGVRIPPSPPSFALWASDGTANFAKHKIRAGRYSATAKEGLRSLGEGGPFSFYPVCVESVVAHAPARPGNTGVAWVLSGHDFAKPAMYYVYLLKSVSDPNRHYVGFSTDLRRRLLEHNTGKLPTTSPHRPWRLSTYLGFTSKKQALAFEHYLKSGSGHAFARKRHWCPASYE